MENRFYISIGPRVGSKNCPDGEPHEPFLDEVVGPICKRCQDLLTNFVPSCAFCEFFDGGRQASVQSARNGLRIIHGDCHNSKSPVFITRSVDFCPEFEMDSALIAERESKLIDDHPALGHFLETPLLAVQRDLAQDLGACLGLLISIALAALFGFAIWWLLR